jgi:hypothetical protein
VTEITRAVVDQYAAKLMLATPEEVVTLKEKIQQLQRAEPLEPKDAGRAE